MPSMPGWFAKLPEMYLLDDYFSDRDGKLGAKYEQILGIVTSKDSEIDKIAAVIGAVGGLGQGDLDHFKAHWLATSDGDFADPGQFFPGVTCRDGYEAEKFAGMLNQATAQACRLGLQSDPVKPMAWVWQCAPNTDFLGAGVADGPNAIVMSITTPPYATNTYGDGQQELRESAPRSFTFQLNFDKPDQKPNSGAPGLSVGAEAVDGHYVPGQEDDLNRTGFLDDGGGC